MTDRGIVLGFDPDTLDVRLLSIAEGAERVLEALVDDDSAIEIGDEFEVHHDDGFSRLVRTGRRAHRSPEPRRGAIVIADGLEVPLPVLLPGLNTKVWTTLGLTDRWLVLENDRSLAHVVGFGDRQAVLTAIDNLRQADEKRNEARAKRAAEKEEIDVALGHRGASARLVNPYSFVPLATEPAARTPPPGHEQITPGNLSGRLSVRWELVAPLLVQEPSGGGTRFPRGTDGQPYVPGSSVKGAIRSMHEALTGSCLRIVDLDHVPVYREPVEAAARTGEWILAIVEEATPDGRPTLIRTCTQVVWIRHDALLQDLPPEDRRTGVRLTVDDLGTEGQGGRREIRQAGSLRADPGGPWVLLLSDAKARPPGREIGDTWYPGNYFATAGRMGPDVLDGCTDPAWQDYLHAVEHADDVRVRRGDTAPNLSVSYKRKATKDGPEERISIGRRQEVTPELAPGTLLWIQARDGRAVAMKRSRAWRVPGKGPVRARVATGWHPCRGDRMTEGLPELCPSCRLFGSVDADGAEDGDDRAARQRSYRGHVRVAFARFEGAPQIQTLRRAALSSPRPGSGQFYLAPDDRQPGNPEAQEPLRKWGSRADRAGNRQIRGRKFYWHGLNGRHIHRDGNEKLVSQVEVAGQGAELIVRLTFENLTPDMLGGLIVSLDPSLALASHRRDPQGGFDPGVIAGRLGGGRPLGLGSVVARRMELVAHDASSRYGAGSPPSVTVDDLVTRFVESVPDAVRKTWPALAAVLSTTWVDATQIRYPDFKFFKASSGARTPMVSLPDPDRFDQSLRADGGRDSG